MIRLKESHYCPFRTSQDYNHIHGQNPFILCTKYIYTSPGRHVDCIDQCTSLQNRINRKKISGSKRKIKYISADSRQRQHYQSLLRSLVTCTGTTKTGYVLKCILTQPEKLHYIHRMTSAIELQACEQHG